MGCLPASLGKGAGSLGTPLDSPWGWTPSLAMECRQKHVLQGAAQPRSSRQLQSHWSKWCEWWHGKDRDRVRKIQGVQKWQPWKLGWVEMTSLPPSPLQEGLGEWLFRCPFKSLKLLLDGSAKAGEPLVIVCRMIEAPTFFLPKLLFGSDKMHWELRGSFVFTFSLFTALVLLLFQIPGSCSPSI